MLKKSMVFVLTMVLMAAVTQADVTHSVTMWPDAAQDAMGVPIVDGTVIMVCDLDGDGWDGNDYLTMPGLASDWLWDDDDLLMGVNEIGNPVPGLGGVTHMMFSVDIPTTYDAGLDDVYVLWFDLPYNTSATGPGGGIDYGIELLGQVGADPGTYTWDVTTGAPAALSTVPEPASMLLMLAGGAAMAAFRRRRRING